MSFRQSQIACYYTQRTPIAFVVMRDLDDLFATLPKSRFRSSFSLKLREREYLATKGRETVAGHARDFVAQRLAPAVLHNDGRQTPFRGHPVFVAQHATATCCRGCLEKWYRIPAGRLLTPEEQAHVVAAIMRWLDAQARQNPVAQPGTASLFD